LDERRHKNETTSRVEKALRAFSIFLGSMAFLMVGTYGFMLWYIEPPEVDRPSMQANAQRAAGSQGGEAMSLQVLPGDAAEIKMEEDGWRRGVHTILIAGEDDGFGGNDVIMVVLFDSWNHTMDVLSIPRDTMVNVPWGLRKINSYQHLFRRLPYDYDHYIYALIDGVAKLIGYPVDHYVIVDLDGFVALVDAIDGVEFDVPQRMLYSDPVQNLFINLQPGLQRLYGQEAMQLVRFRTYPQGDIQRIRVQHDFLRALTSQLLQARNVLILDELVHIFQSNVETDLSFRNLLWFGTEFLRMDHENLRFHAVDNTIANINDHVNGISYVTLYVEPWLRLINTYMNPFTWEIRAEDLEILTRDPVTGTFFTTNGAPFGTTWWGR